MILYDLEKMRRHKSIVFTVQCAVVAAHSTAFHYLGVPFTWSLVWSVLAMAGLAFLQSFYTMVGQARASMQIFGELEAAEVPFEVVSGKVP